MGNGLNLRTSPAASTAETDSIRKVPLRLGGRPITGTLACTPQPRSLVLIIDGRGDKEPNPLVEPLLSQLQKSGFEVLSIDLLHPDEADDPILRFDVPMLAERLSEAAYWLQNSNNNLPLMLVSFGIAAAASLWSLERVGATAVVSISGCPHLAEPRLGQVKTPTLLMVYGKDPKIEHTNQQATHRLQCESVPVIPKGRSARQIRQAEKTLAATATSWLESQLGEAPPKSRKPHFSWSTSTLGFLVRRMVVAVLSFLSMPR